MADKSGDPEFVYEISCDQMCGNGHTRMRGTIIVETQEEFDRWMASQKPQYTTAMGQSSPQPQPADSTKKPADTLKTSAMIKK
jgi:cytochrome c oxidase subunit 2